jgi:hypothetical protein
MPTTTPVTVVTSSKKYSLTAPDWLKALLIAVISPVIPIIYTAITAASSPTGTFVMPWKLIALTAASAFLSYITKNFFTPAQTVITGAPTGSSVNITTPAAGSSITTTAVTK